MAEQQNQAPQIGISRIYLKDLSFESPKSPELFRKEFRPEIKINVAVKHTHLEGALYEVVLELNVTGVQEGAELFIVEAEQAGLFVLQGFPTDLVDKALKVFCPNILYPYLRQCVDSAMTMGSLPSLMLPPVNFEALPANPPN